MQTRPPPATSPDPPERTRGTPNPAAASGTKTRANLRNPPASIRRVPLEHPTLHAIKTAGNGIRDNQRLPRRVTDSIEWSAG